MLGRKTRRFLFLLAYGLIGPSEIQMSSETIIRPVRVEELSGVLRLWQEAAVTPPSVTDSIEGLTREPAVTLLMDSYDQ
jgi:hypothetical protein